MDGHQTNLKSFLHDPAFSRISFHDLMAGMGGRIPAFELGFRQKKTVKRKKDRSGIAQIGSSDHGVGGNDDLVFPSRDVVVDGIVGSSKHVPGLAKTAIDREEKVRHDSVSDGDDMMGRRVDHMGMKGGVAIGPDGKKDGKDSNEKWEGSRLHLEISFSKDVRKMIEFLMIALLTFGLSVPAAFAEQDPFASGQNPFAYSAVSATLKTRLSLYPVTLYLSGRDDLPTTVFLPTVAVRKVGMDSPKGWNYEFRTTDSPVYRKRGEDPRKRALVTEIVLSSLPSARKTDIVLLGDQDRVFLLHLIPHPRDLAGKPVYSLSVIWWPKFLAFNSPTYRPVPSREDKRFFPSGADRSAMPGIGR